MNWRFAIVISTLLLSACTIAPKHEAGNSYIPKGSDSTLVTIGGNDTYDENGYAAIVQIRTPDGGANTAIMPAQTCGRLFVIHKETGQFTVTLRDCVNGDPQQAPNNITFDWIVYKTKDN
jgi:hypothetical protein